MVKYHDLPPCRHQYCVSFGSLCRGQKSHLAEFFNRLALNLSLENLLDGCSKVMIIALDFVFEGVGRT